MSKPSSPSLSLKPLATLFSKFHMTLFFVVMIGCLAVAVLLINDMLTNSPPDDTYVSPITPGTIAQATLDRIQALHNSSQPSSGVVLPEGRVNAFGE